MSVDYKNIVSLSLQNNLGNRVTAEIINGVLVAIAHAEESETAKNTADEGKSDGAPGAQA